jgi:hypothetical protein
VADPDELLDRRQQGSRGCRGCGKPTSPSTPSPEPAVIDHPLIATQQHTCIACPDQWEGTLIDGQRFYFRYRGGIASLGVTGDGTDPAEDPGEVCMEHGEPLQGSFDSDDERSQVFAELLRRRFPFDDRKDH